MPKPRRDDNPDRQLLDTPLIVAARFGQEKCVRMLLDAKADVTAKDMVRERTSHGRRFVTSHRNLRPAAQFGKTALQHARDAVQPEVAALLHDYMQQNPVRMSTD